MNNTYSLQGMTLLITRPLHQATDLIDAIKAAGGKTLLLPTITIEDAIDQESLQRALAGFGNADFVIFTSANAVHKSAGLIHYYWPKLPDSVQIIPIGPATSSALLKENLPSHYLPDAFNSEGLLALSALQNIKNKTVMIIKGEGGRTLIASTLKERGARVIETIAYRRIRPHAGNFWQTSKKLIDIVICTSSEGLQNLFTMAGKAGTQYLQKIPFVVISHRMATTANQLGIKNFWISNNVTVSAIMSAIIKGRSIIMNNEIDNSPTNTKKRNSPASLTTIFSTVSMLLGLFILAMVFGIYQEMNKQQQHVLSVVSLLQRSIQQNQQLNTVVTSGLSGLQHQLEDQHSTIKNTESQIQQTLGNKKADNKTQTKSEVSYILQQAVLTLTYDRNVPGAIALLQTADHRLQAINDPINLKLRQAIANSITQLQAVPVPDIDGILARISALQQQVNQLPLYVPPETIKAPLENKPVTSHLSGWRKAVSMGWDSVQQLVIIRRHNQPVAPLVSPQQEVYLRQNVLLQLQQAQWAALHGQANAYRTSLEQASHWVSHYFAQNAANTNAMLAALKELQVINVSPPLPDVSSTLVGVKEI